MQQRIVMWGEIGTDLKALITIQLDEQNTNIIIHAFPKDDINSEFQESLFILWKNGGDFQIPDTTYQWTVDANQDNILPENIRVERPELITQAQMKWSRKLMSAKLDQLLTEEIALLHQNIESIKDFDQELWNKAKQQWDKISDYQKKGEISWEQTTSLKDKINQIFDALKALKRINQEDDDAKLHHTIKDFESRIATLQNKLIYPDEWSKISNELKVIQNELKAFPIRWVIKRKLQNKINDIYTALKKYRSTEFINKTKIRIKQLTQILSGFKETVERDKENLKTQVEKMRHYTRGKLSDDKIQQQFSHITERIKSKEQKITNISKTIHDLEKDIKKEAERQELELQKAKEPATQLDNKEEQVTKHQESTENSTDRKDKNNSTETPTNTSEEETIGIV